MKKQLLVIWCGIATWVTVQGMLAFLANEFRIEAYPELTQGIMSVVAGFCGGQVILSLSCENKVKMLLIPLLSVATLWIFAFPTPIWRNAFLWNWPLWGLATIWVVVFFGQYVLNNPKQCAAGRQEK